MALSEALRAHLRSIVDAHHVVLFMKGTRLSPQCGFSATVVGILDAMLPAYHTVDVLADPALLGKPTGRDLALGRPSAAAAHGLLGAVEHFHGLIQNAADAVPDCRGNRQLRALVRAESERLVPAAWCDQLARTAA
jgi:hypothetical protein